MRLAVVWIAELVYVVMVHGGRQAWKHGLPFLARVPVGLRKNRDAYGTGLIERYRPGTPDLAEDEDDDGMGLVPVPFKSAYVGQGDAPPVYTEGDGITPTSSRPEVVELAELRLPTESLPPFPVDLPVVESRDERWAAHKAAVLASPLSTVDEKRR
ncbi:hypothetical protein CspHIS471_0601840 [Cutaneotrichosporon sp. HIS471]|nr:hypothetical protein CspHIS471_0601840 [Cutaneotrichosporon sp. HIS471]